jgi:D-alanyl-D-alanine endopeptidase (penicillin-binding protein 7)
MDFLRIFSGLLHFPHSMMLGGKSLKSIVFLLAATFMILSGSPALFAAGDGKGKARSLSAPSSSVKANRAKTATPGKKQKSSGTASRKASGKTAKKRLPTRAKTATRTVTTTAKDEVWRGDPQTLRSSSVLVLAQQSGKVLLAKNPDAQLPIASISKLMTAMVALDAGQDPEEVLVISSADVDGRKGTRSRLPVGTTMTRDTALLLALMSSENRAASALARHYPGGTKAFVAAMNAKARSLGLSRTRFEEPTGLSARNVSTPHDLARLTANAYRYAKIREYSTMAAAHLDLSGTRIVFRNTNTLVQDAKWRIGLSKTGYISESGHCLVMQARLAGKPVVMVLMDASGKTSRTSDANRIKRWILGT